MMPIITSMNLISMYFWTELRHDDPHRYLYDDDDDDDGYGDADNDDDYQDYFCTTLQQGWMK